MAIVALMLAGALACGPQVAVDHRPVKESRADAIVQAAKQGGAAAPAPDATAVRYPSADGDILAGLGKGMAVPPLKPARPIAADFGPPKAKAATSAGVDASGLLGGPRQ